MSQQLNVNLSIPIPADSILISRVELEDLRKQELAGVYWSMKDLEQRTGKKCEWIKENILYPERFRKILDIDNGGFVFYPKSKGQTWSFQATKMASFLDKHFSQIFKNTE
jgi:phage pi2 protein 07